MKASKPFDTETSGIRLDVWLRAFPGKGVCGEQHEGIFWELGDIPWNGRGKWISKIFCNTKKNNIFPLNILAPCFQSSVPPFGSCEGGQKILASVWPLWLCWILKYGKYVEGFLTRLNRIYLWKCTPGSEEVPSFFFPSALNQPGVEWAEENL